jgi:hypothetical protein
LAKNFEKEQERLENESKERALGIRKRKVLAKNFEKEQERLEHESKERALETPKDALHRLYTQTNL